MIRSVAALAFAVAVAGCGLLPDAAPPPVEVPVGPLGPIFEDPDGGPPIECRGVPQDNCAIAGQLEDAVVDVPIRDVERVIVTCTTRVCGRTGEYRIDALLRDGTIREIAGGGYGESQ
jgi:hypothetical protein